MTVFVTRLRVGLVWNGLVLRCLSLACASGLYGAGLYGAVCHSLALRACIDRVCIAVFVTRLRFGLVLGWLSLACASGLYGAGLYGAVCHSLALRACIAVFVTRLRFGLVLGCLSLACASGLYGLDLYGGLMSSLSRSEGVVRHHQPRNRRKLPIRMRVSRKYTVRCACRLIEFCRSLAPGLLCDLFSMLGFRRRGGWWLRVAAGAEVEDLDHQGKRHREVDVTARHMAMKAFGDQHYAD